MPQVHQDLVLHECINCHNFIVTFLKRRDAFPKSFWKFCKYLSLGIQVTFETLARNEMEKPHDLLSPLQMQLYVLQRNLYKKNYFGVDALNKIPIKKIVKECRREWCSSPLLIRGQIYKYSKVNQSWCCKWLQQTQVNIFLLPQFLGCLHGLDKTFKIKMENVNRYSCYFYVPTPYDEKMEGQS